MEALGGSNLGDLSQNWSEQEPLARNGFAQPGTVFFVRILVSSFGCTHANDFPAICRSNANNAIDLTPTRNGSFPFVSK